MPSSLSRLVVAVSVLGVASVPAGAQVALDPLQIAPGAWERIAVRVVSQASPHIVTVQVTVPEALMVLGLEPLAGWQSTVTAATDTTPQTIEWVGGAVLPGQFVEFAFLGRLAGDARRGTLVVPVRLTKADGSTVEWRRGGDAPVPFLRIVPATTVSAWGAIALAGASLGVAALALVLSMLRQRPSRSSP